MSELTYDLEHPEIQILLPVKMDKFTIGIESNLLSK